jgi:hypothetical protein
LGILHWVIVTDQSAFVLPRPPSRWWAASILAISNAFEQLLLLAVKITLISRSAHYTFSAPPKMITMPLHQQNFLLLHAADTTFNPGYQTGYSSAVISRDMKLPSPKPRLGTRIGV